MEFSRQEFWSGLPFPSSGDQTCVSMSSALAGGLFTTSATQLSPLIVFLFKVEYLLANINHHQMRNIKIILLKSINIHRKISPNKKSSLEVSFTCFKAATLACN